MSVWRGEVNIDSVVLSIPSATLFPLFQGAYAAASYAFTCEDIDALAGNTQLYIKVNQIHDRQVNGAGGSNVYFTRMTAGSFLPFEGDPYDGVIFDSSGQFQNDTGDGGGGFRGGGVLSIEKDTTTGVVTFTSPAGVWTTTTAILGIAMTTKIRPLSIGLLLQAQDIPPASNSAQSLTVNWSHLAGKQDGTTICGAAMSTGDPGMWDAWAESSLFSPLFTQSFIQQPTVEESTLTFPADATPAFIAIVDGWYRVFTGPDVFPPSALDMTTAREHGPLFAMLVYGTSPSVVRFRRTYDTGTSWLESDLYNSAGTVNKSPTMLWHKGRLYGVWQRDSAIIQSVSPDLGVSWGTPVTLSITGINPRAIIDPRHGMTFYFFIDAGDLKLRRSANFGTDWVEASPITVATSVGAQTVAAEVASDGSLLVSYIASGAWTQLRSKDMGVSWA